MTTRPRRTSGRLRISPAQAELTYTQRCLQILKSSGARLTTPRRLVLECLENATSPQSPVQILEKIGAESGAGAIDKVTVYRILEGLVRLELVHQVSPSGGYIPCTHVDCTTSGHVVTHCTTCGNFAELHLDPGILSSLAQALKKQSGFSLGAQHLELQGVCALCQR